MRPVSGDELRDMVCAILAEERERGDGTPLTAATAIECSRGSLDDAARDAPPARRQLLRAAAWAVIAAGLTEDS